MPSPATSLLPVPSVLPWLRQNASGRYEDMSLPTNRPAGWALSRHPTIACGAIARNEGRSIPAVGSLHPASHLDVPDNMSSCAFAQYRSLSPFLKFLLFFHSYSYTATLFCFPLDGDLNPFQIHDQAFDGAIS